MAGPTNAVVSSTGGIKLDVRVYERQAASSDGQPFPSNSLRMPVVLVHQYSLMGGNQRLMEGMARMLAARGFACVTFDMRGVGKSTGMPSITGASEVDDVVAVCKWTLQRLNTPRILLVGSSAGAPIAGSAFDQVPQIAGYVGIGYTFGVWASILFGRHFQAILTSPKPKLFIMGTRDGFTSVAKLEKKLESARGKTLKHLIPDIGHFELEAPLYDALMVDQIIAFAQENLGPPTHIDD